MQPAKEEREWEPVSLNGIKPFFQHKVAVHAIAHWPSSGYYYERSLISENAFATGYLMAGNDFGLINRMDRKKEVTFLAVCLFVTLLLFVGPGQAVMIDDRAGGTIYWGGKYVNIKPSRYGDVIGRRSAVDQMEVTMNDDIMTVTITGPYFFNYLHSIKRTQDAPPGDLYISSKGWKVSGSPPYTKDAFTSSEGWDYVVSLENNKVYQLKFSDIVMTAALPYTTKYRADQAWRGGYGKALDDAAVTLTETGLAFIFSIRTMRLESEIGLHWTMKCGNDIIEGSALIPPIAITPPVVPTAKEVGPDPIDVELTGELAAPEFPAASTVPSGSAAPVSEALPSAIVGGGGFPYVWPLLAAAIIPTISFGSHHEDASLPVTGATGPVITVDSLSEPRAPAPVPEPSIPLLLLAGLSIILISRRPHNKPRR
jgi:hypothetical protein